MRKIVLDFNPRLPLRIISPRCVRTTGLSQWRVWTGSNLSQHPKKQCQNKNSRYRSKVPTQESDDASGKRPTKAKVLVVHRIGSSALTASA
jgi:hypothetical protein